MSAPADVLAVLDLACECLRNSSQQTPSGMAIHSAVAQARSAISVLVGVADCGKRNGDEQERRQWLEELDAALRAIGGVE